MRLQKLANHDKPRERFLSHGVRSLTDEELLAILIGKGTKTEDALDLGYKIVNTLINRNVDINYDNLIEINGIGTVKAMIITAAIEFARRRIKPDGFKLSCPQDILVLLRHYATRKQEHFISISLNGAKEVLSIDLISVGLIDSTIVHAREVFNRAVKQRASSIIVAHNHCTGKLIPSKADIDTTNQLVKAGKILGIKVYDHLIFSIDDYYSFLINGLIKDIFF